MRLLRSHGLTSDTWARHRGDEVDYDVLEPGFNFRLDEPRAALGLRLLERLRRRQRDRGPRSPLATPTRCATSPACARRSSSSPAVDSAWHIFPLLLDPDVDRARRFADGSASTGVQTSVHYPPLHLTRAFGDRRRGGRCR